MKRFLFIALMFLSFGLVFTACNSGNSEKENSNTGTDKKEQLAEGEMHTCSMHNEVMSSKPGTCPKCGMKLEKQKMTATQEKMMKEGTYVKSKEEQ